MSIVNDLIELNDDKSNIQDALVAKGVTSASKHGFNKFAEDIASITNQYTSSDEGKVVSNGSLVVQTDYGTVTENGTYDTTLNNSVTVEISSSNNSICAMLYYNSDFSTMSGISLSVFNNSLSSVFVGGNGPAGTYYVNPNDMLLSDYFSEDDVISGSGYPISNIPMTTYPTAATVSCKMKISTNTVVISRSGGSAGNTIYFTCYKNRDD